MVKQITQEKTLKKMGWKIVKVFYDKQYMITQNKESKIILINTAFNDKYEFYKETILAILIDWIKKDRNFSIRPSTNFDAIKKGLQNDEKV